MQFDDHGLLELPVQGFEVLHLGIGAFVADIFTYGEAGATSHIRLGEEFELRDADGRTQILDPGDWPTLAALFALRHDRIRILQITRTSDLRVEFTSGRVITCSPNGGPYEAWETHAPGGVLVVGRAGEPVIWDSETKATTFKRGGVNVAPTRP